MVHHDLWDYDKHRGAATATIIHDSKPGTSSPGRQDRYLYVFDRVTVSPSGRSRATLSGQRRQGEQTADAAPPTAPPPFVRQSLTAADINPHILTSRQRSSGETHRQRPQRACSPRPRSGTRCRFQARRAGANWGTTAANPARGMVYVLGINVPSIYKLSAEAPRPGGLQPVGPAEIAQGRALYETRCQACHGGNLTGGGNYPSLIDVTGRLGADAVRDKITGGGPGMPPTDDLTDPELTSLIGFLANPSTIASDAAENAAPAPATGPVVASGGAPAGQAVPPGRAGGMVGPDYPPGVPVPEIRMYTGYGMNGTIVKPPYSTLTAYDLNTGTIRWQVPAGGDDPRAAAEGAKDTGYILQRTGIITTATGLLFHAGGDGRFGSTTPTPGPCCGRRPCRPDRAVFRPYEANGRQFLLVNATSSLQVRVLDGPGAGAVPAYVAFALPEVAVK